MPSLPTLVSVGLTPWDILLVVAICLVATVVACLCLTIRTISKKHRLQIWADLSKQHENADPDFKKLLKDSSRADMLRWRGMFEWRHIFNRRRRPPAG